MLLLFVVVSNFLLNTRSDSYEMQNILNLRMETLKEFSSKITFDESLNCSRAKFMTITKNKFGRSGNNLIEFTHLLWLSKKYKATFVPPTWMLEILSPFNTSILESSYCVQLRGGVPKDARKVIEVSSEESFYLPHLWNKNNNWNPYRTSLPPLNSATIEEISLVFLKVYAALWSSPIKSVQAAGEWVITHHLNNNFRYTSVHKRQMEGACSKLLFEGAKLKDFYDDEIPTWRPEWKSKSHPLCDMSYDFIYDTQLIHNQNGSKIFIAFDGRGEIDSYRKHGVVFSDVL